MSRAPSAPGCLLSLSGPAFLLPGIGPPPDYPTAFLDGGCNRRSTSSIAGEVSVW